MRLPHVRRVTNLSVAPILRVRRRLVVRDCVRVTQTAEAPILRTVSGPNWHPVYEKR